MNQDIMQKLGAPFSFEEVEAKIQVNGKEKPVGMAVFYIKSRAIQKRLDEVVGALNWANQFTTWRDKSQICGISILNAERGEWVTKHDGAENSDIEAIKGGLTDAFKRAAVLWGIGRYLSQIDGVWVDVEKRGNSSIIKDNQMGKLKIAYEAAVKRIFGAAAGQRATDNPNTQQKPAPAQPTVSTNKPDSDVLPFDFKIYSMKPSGKTSQLLELCAPDGELTSAYIRNGEAGIAVGAHLKNVNFEAKKNGYAKYNLITGYEVAAA